MTHKVTGAAEESLQRVDSMIAGEWARLLETSALIRAIRGGELRKELYAAYMLETYHYTAHNARNQAATGIAYAEQNPTYAKFCFHHAEEETGHELMALHDLRSLGFAVDKAALPTPLPETEALIAYLYWIATHGNPYRRLGYSLWAESSYQYINPIVDKVQSTLVLGDGQLTFFRAHSGIDAEHAKEVRSVILRTCKTSDDWDALADVAITSLSLTGRMLDAVYADYRGGATGRPRRIDTLTLAKT